MSLHRHHATTTSSRVNREQIRFVARRARLGIVDDLAHWQTDPIPNRGTRAIAKYPRGTFIAAGIVVYQTCATGFSRLAGPVWRKDCVVSVPFSQAWAVARHVLRQRSRGVRRYPLVLMLEPLFRCNLACAGCGKIQHPAAILRRQLTPEQCFAAVEECGAPIVSIPGGEPLLHPQIGEIVAGLVSRSGSSICAPTP